MPYVSTEEALKKIVYFMQEIRPGAARENLNLKEATSLILEANRELAHREAEGKSVIAPPP